MTIELTSDCDICGKRIDLGDHVYCEKCVDELKTQVDDLIEQVDDLESQVAELES